MNFNKLIRDKVLETFTEEKDDDTVTVRTEIAHDTTHYFLMLIQELQENMKHLNITYEAWFKANEHNNYAAERDRDYTEEEREEIKKHLRNTKYSLGITLADILEASESFFNLDEAFNKEEVMKIKKERLEDLGGFEKRIVLREFTRKEG